MGDIEDGCGSDGQKKCYMGCCGLFVLICSVFFAVCMSAYHHLGPDDQILIKTPRGHEVKNGQYSGQFNPFHERVWRKATLLNQLEYAIVQDRLTARVEAIGGPKLLFLEAYQDLKEVLPKLVLEKDEYVRLVDRTTGMERVERGPGTITPEPTEDSEQGIQKAIMLNMDASVVIRNKTNGILTLITKCTHTDGVYAPAPMEELVEIRRLIHVLPHEALIVRDVQGMMKVYSAATSDTNDDDTQSCFPESSAGAGTAFFLPPYSKIVRMSWSSYAAPTGAAQPTRRLQVIPVADEASLYVDQLQATTHAGPKVKVAAIDLRTQKSFYKYEVRTSDNVKLELEGTVFWMVTDVQKMIKMTSDPAGDVWAKARSTLIGAISNTTLAGFMKNFHILVGDAFNTATSDVFYTRRGLAITNMELTKYSPVDEHTKEVLQNIIRQTVNRINDLQKQRSQNDVLREKLNMDIQLEDNRTNLIESQANNSRLLAEMAGSTDGTKIATEIGSFVDGLDGSIENTTDRLELFKTHKLQQSTNKDTQQLSNGDASLYVAPKDLDLRLQMPHSGPEL